MPEDLPSILAREATQHGLGAVEASPADPLFAGDRGPLRGGLSLRDGHVILNFGKSLSWVAMTPAEATALGRGLLAFAERAVTDQIGRAHV